MSPRHLLPLVLLALSACGNNETSLPTLWAADGLTPAADGLYVPVAGRNGLVFLTPDGASASVGLGDQTLAGLYTSPDHATTWARLEQWQCDVADKKEARKVKVRDDCPNHGLSATRTLHPLVAGSVGPPIDLDPQYDSFTWSPDGRFAVGFTAGAVEGFVNLTSVVVVDTATNTPTAVAVGFGAQGAAFSADASKVIVLTKTEVVLIDLAGTPSRVASFELTANKTEVIDPIGAEITADGHYALVTLAGKRDLYVLDLVNPSINLVGLSGTPAAMLDGDRTILAYTDTSAVDLLDHDLFEIQTVRLDSPMDRIVAVPDGALLWRQGAQDVYHLDIATGDTVRYRLVGPARALELLPDNSGALVFSGTNTVELVDLANDDGDIDLVFGLGGVPLAMAITPSALGPKAIVLVQDSSDLVVIDVFAATASTIELSGSPLGIGALPGGPFYVAESEPLGLVGFIDPETLTTTEAAGFATMGLLDEVPVLVVEPEVR